MNRLYSILFATLVLFQIGFSPSVKLENDVFTFCEGNSFDLKYGVGVYDFVNLNIDHETGNGIISVLYNGKVYEREYEGIPAKPLITFDNSISLMGHGLNFETNCGEFSFSSAAYDSEIPAEDMPRRHNWFVEIIIRIFNVIRSWFK